MGKLVIDLGHGGHDPGAIGPNKTHEADVVLAIGKELNELLKGYDLEVKFTRLSDVYLSLSERAKIANDFKADYFLSIHPDNCFLQQVSMPCFVRDIHQRNQNFL